MTSHRKLRQWLAPAGMLCALPVWAQTPPNTGTLLQELRPAPAIEPRTDVPALEIKPPPRKAMTAPGGLQVRIARLRVTGATVFTEAQLLPLVQQAQGKSMGLDGLGGACRDHHAPLPCGRLHRGARLCAGPGRAGRRHRAGRDRRPLQRHHHARRRRSHPRAAAAGGAARG